MGVSGAAAIEAAGAEMIPVPSSAISFWSGFLGRPKVADKNLQAPARVPPLGRSWTI